MVSHCGRRLLARHHHVDVIAAAQAVVGDAQEAVRVGRQVDADHLGLLVDDVVDEPRILMAEAVVVLPPDMARQQVVEGRDGAAPGNVLANLEPLGVLVEHRVDDVDEGLVAGQEPVPAGKQVPLQPALALMLGQHLHHPPVRREVVVVGEGPSVPRPVGDLEDVLPAIRVVLVRAEEAEITGLEVALHDVPEEPAHHPRGLRGRRPGAGDVHRVVPEVRKPQVLEQQAAVAVGVGTHPPRPLGGHVGQLRLEPATGLEEFLGPIALHPVFEELHVRRVVVHLAHGHLVGAPESLGLLAIDLTRAGPPLGCAQDDHGPPRPLPGALAAGDLLDALDLRHDRVEGAGHQSMHRLGIVPFHEVGV
jgi:hypothetical protein